jgi:hypothetical protein
VTAIPQPSPTLVTGRALYRPRADNADPLSLVEAAVAGGVKPGVVRQKRLVAACGIEVHRVIMTAVNWNVSPFSDTEALVFGSAYRHLTFAG